jgi:hypothetical protein
MRALRAKIVEIASRFRRERRVRYTLRLAIVAMSDTFANMDTERHGAASQRPRPRGRTFGLARWRAEAPRG